MNKHTIQGTKDVPTPNDVIREIWRRVLDTSNPKVAFKGIEEIAKWQKIRDAEQSEGSSTR